MFEYIDGFAKFADVKSYKVVSCIMSEEPLVSIMIPTYRRPELLKETIESALSQETDFPFEVVVVDNDSTELVPDAISNVVKGFRAKNLSLCRNEKNLGMIGNWNRCIELARSDWLVILHDDDLVKQNWLQATFGNKSQRSLVASSFEIFGDNFKETFIKGLIKKTLQHFLDLFRYKSSIRAVQPSDVLIDCPICASGAMLNKTACLELGGYDPDKWPLCDYLFSAKYIAKFGGFVLKERFVKYRIAENESGNPDTFLAVPDGTYKLRSNVLFYMASTGTAFYLLSAIIAYMHKLEARIAMNRFNLHKVANSGDTTAKRHIIQVITSFTIPPGLVLRLIFFICWLVITLHDLIPGVRKLTFRSTNCRL